MKFCMKCKLVSIGKIYLQLLKHDFSVYPLVERTLPIVIKWYILTTSTAVSVGKLYPKHSSVIKYSVLFYAVNS